MNLTEGFPKVVQRCKDNQLTMKVFPGAVVIVKKGEHKNNVLFPALCISFRKCKSRFGVNSKT